MSRKIHILYTNDLHSHFEQMSKIATYVSHLRDKWQQKGEPSLLLDIGDHMDRFRIETEGTDGEVNRAILEKTGYDIITLGNNELLSFSKEQLEKNYLHSPFQVISGNIWDDHSQKQPSWIKPYLRLNINGFIIGFLAVTIPYSLVYKQMGWLVKDPLMVLQEQVNRLKMNTDMIVVLSHLGLNSDRRIAKCISEIDVILGAHTHHLIEVPELIENTYISAAGKFGRHLGLLTIEYHSPSNEILHIYGKCKPITQEIKDSPEINQLIYTYDQMALTHLSKPITFLNKPLDVNWDHESPLGNLLADSLYDWTKADFSLINSGLLLKGLKKGTVTYYDLHQICPHPINPSLITIKGKEIRRTLEQSLLEEYIHKQIYGYGFRGKQLGSICVSGLKVMYNPLREAYNKIQSIYIGENLLEDEKVYRVGTLDMFTFGVGYLNLKNGQVIQHYLPEFLRNVLAHSLQDDSQIEKSYYPRWFKKAIS